MTTLNTPAAAAPAKALLGTKLGMTQIWDENGVLRPVTVVRVDTNVVTQVRTIETDGYEAVQLAFGDIDARKVTKPLAGHFAKAGVEPRRHVAEIRTSLASEFTPGQELAAEGLGDRADLHGGGGCVRMGHARRTVQNLKIRGIDVDKGVLLVNGAIPGPKGSVVVVRTAVKGA